MHSPYSYVTTKRKRPTTTSTNAAIARAPFGDEFEKEQPIPTIINDYNHYMGGVDIANQYRASYDTHRKGRRNWLPLLFFFLEAAIINAYRIQYIAKEQQGTSKRELPTHKGFRKKLYKELFSFARAQPQPGGLSHQRIPLPSSASTSKPKQRNCAVCEVKDKQGKDKKKGRTSRTSSSCLECGVPLCVKGACWEEWHTTRSN